MRLPSPEALTISSVLNTGDLSDAVYRGLTPEHFNGYRTEYEFILNYSRRYGSLPSPDILTGSFPDFPYRSSATETAFYCDQTIERFNQRQIKQALLESTQHLANGNSAASLAAVQNVRLTSTAAPAVDAVRSYLVHDELDAESEIGVPYPWPTPQRLTGGMMPGDFVVFGARTGVGKSWSLVYAACAAAQQGLSVRYLSMEMPAAQLVERIHVILGNQLGYRISHTALHHKTVDRILYKKLLADLQTKIGGRIDVIDSAQGRITPRTIGCLGRRVDLVVVDYLQLMSTPDGRRAVEDWRVMASISNECKEAAIAVNLPVLAAAQLNRDGVRGNPTVAELAQSDAIGQDADVVIMQKRMDGDAMRYRVEKNRHGLSNASFYSRFEPDYGRLNEVSKEIAEDICDDSEAD